MNDVMKKRLIGVAVLVVIGVVTPLLLSQCLHGDDAGDGSMRVYNVTPSGSAQSASDESEGGGKSEQGKQSDDQTHAGDDDQAEQDGDSQPDAVSPQDNSSADDDESFSTPPVSGADESATSDSQQDNSKQTERGSQPAKQDTSREASDDNEAQASSSQSSERSQSNVEAQRNDSASGWVVQVAASTKLSNAKALVQELSADYRASYAKAKVDGKTWYRVNVGPFADEEAARSSAASLKKQGRKPLVRHLP